MTQQQREEIMGLVERLDTRASHTGCTGLFNGNCVEDAPNDYTDWCIYCLAAAAAKALTATGSPGQGDWTQRGMPSVEEIDIALAQKTWHESKMHCLALLTRVREALKKLAPSLKDGQDERIQEIAREANRRAWSTCYGNGSEGRFPEPHVRIENVILSAIREAVGEASQQGPR